MPDTVLITGGSGFIGSHLILELLARGDRVVNYDIRPHSGPMAWLL
ncbi:MAG: NAD-dependent epimerase/dehydratase family protein, partial [Opitutaceae bacterium]